MFLQIFSILLESVKTERLKTMKNEKMRYGLICMLLLLLMPVSASANIVWPSLYIAAGLRSWYVVLMGLVIEIVFVKCFLKETYTKSVLIAFIMNLVSTVIGAVAIPVSGFLGELIMIPFGKGTFHLTHWIMSYILAILSNVLVEGIAIKIIFKKEFKKIFLWLCIANAISIVICILFHGVTMQNVNI